MKIHDIVTCKVVLVTIMTGSSSDDCILLVLRLKPLLITLNQNTIAILHTLQSLHTNPLSLFPLVFTLTISLWTHSQYHCITAQLKSSHHMLNLHRPTSSSTANFPRLFLTQNASKSELFFSQFIKDVLHPRPCTLKCCLLNYWLLASEFTSYEHSAHTPQKTRLGHYCIT
jgi:hypothetical protein